MTLLGEHSTSPGDTTYTVAEHEDYIAKWQAAEMRRPLSTGWWFLEGILPERLYEGLLERRNAAGDTVGRIAVREKLRQQTESRHERMGSWRSASEYVRKSRNLLGNKLVGSGKKISRSWLGGKLTEPHMKVQNVIKPDQMTSVQCGDETMYTDVTELDVVSVLHPEVEQIPGRTYEIAVFPPYTKRVRGDNLMKRTARFGAKGYQKIWTTLRISDGNTVLEDGERIGKVERASCTETQAEALQIVARQVFQELYDLRIDDHLGSHHQLDQE